MLFIVKEIFMSLHSGEGFSPELFFTPPADCEVSYSWLWNTPITKEGIDEGLKEIWAAGVRSIYILPLPIDFRPELTRTYMSPAYLSEQFWALTKYALDKACEMGFTPWLYDEGGWPSGGACGRTLQNYPEGVARLLYTREVTLSAGEGFTPSEGFIALYNGRVRLPADYVAKDDITLTEYYEGETFARAFTDYTDPRVTEEFLKNTYEKYKEHAGEHFGKHIPLIFTDEPGLKQYTLPKNTFERFLEKYGYNLKDFIYVIPDDGALARTEEERRARIDYCEFVGELFLKNTFDKISEWCGKNGICYAGHLMADNYPDSIRCGYFSQVDILRRFDIPGVDAIWEQIRFPYGGRDPFDGEETARMPFFPRLAPSAARQTGKNVSLTEAMGIYGDGITPDEIKYVSNYHLIRGVNYLSFAHIPFSASRFSALATRPDFRPEKPGFYNLGQINRYLARLSYLARLGYAEGEVALYHPCRDYCAGKDVSEAAVESYRALGVSLEENSIPFDIIDDAGIRAAAITPEGLRLGDAIYRYIAVPECRYMPEDVKEKCEKFLGMGTPVYKFKNKFLRVMTRRLDEGRLWFIFNEGEDAVREELSISARHIYKLNADLGEIYEVDRAEAVLGGGDMAVFLLADKVYPTVSEEVEFTCELSGFEPDSYKKLLVTFDGLYNEYGKGAPSDGEPFSGEVSYTASYTLDNEPKVGERYKLSLSGFSLTAAAELGGKRYTFGTTPMEAIIEGGSLPRSGEIKITVANSALDEIQAKEHLKRFYPKAELGPYLGRIEEFEKKVPTLRFGKVYLSKMK